MNGRVPAVLALQVAVRSVDDVGFEEMGELAHLIDTPVTNILTSLMELTNSDTDSDEDAYINNFVSITVPSYTDIQFRQHFRMSRGCFEVWLLRLIIDFIDLSDSSPNKTSTVTHVISNSDRQTDRQTKGIRYSVVF